MQELEHQLYEIKGVSSPTPSDPVPFWLQNQFSHRRSSVACSKDAVLLKLKGNTPNQVNHTSSSASLPTFSPELRASNTTLPLRPCISRVNTKRSSVSDEVKIEGGVALTEEAVDMQTPDLITQT